MRKRNKISKSTDHRCTGIEILWNKRKAYGWKKASFAGAANPDLQCLDLLLIYNSLFATASEKRSQS